MSEALKWTAAFVVVTGLCCLYYLSSIAETLKKILGHMESTNADVNEMAENTQESYAVLKQIRDNASKK